MIIKRKTQIILALLVSSIFLFQACATLSRGTPEGRSPERKHGAKLIITKKDGLRIAGELIAVKQNSLLLLSITDRDVRVGIADIKAVRIVKPSKFRKGARIGGAMGTAGGVGFLVAVDVILEKEQDAEFKWYVIFGAIGLAIGMVCGGLIGELLGTDKIIQIEGESDSEIKDALDYLRKKARIRDYR